MVCKVAIGTERHPVSVGKKEKNAFFLNYSLNINTSSMLQMYKLCISVSDQCVSVCV